MKISKPVVRRLDQSEIRQVIERNNVARVGFDAADWIEIHPIHYVFADDYLIGRTSKGTMLSALAQRCRVAVQIDEIESLFEWESVLIRSVFLRIPAGSAPYEEALSNFRGLVPGTFGPDDPTPFRTVLFRIPLQNASGRQSLQSDRRPEE